MQLSCRAHAQNTRIKDGTQWAVVNVSDAFMREEPRYGSECVSQTRMGTLVQVLERKGYWVRIKTPEPYEGWVNELALAPTREIKPAEQKQTRLYGATLRTMTSGEAGKYLRAPKMICTGADPVKVFKAPPTDVPQGLEVLTTLLQGNIVRAKAGTGGMLEIVLPDGKTGFAPSSAFEDFSGWAEAEAAESDEEKAAQIVSLAKTFLGVPYLWGGMSPGHFDCSGLTGFCFFMNGLLLPRDASQQVKCGIEVPFDQMQAGDLVFFGDTSVGHVALCIGDHKIIHASQLVRINSLLPGEPGYYGRNILHIRRIIGHLEDGELKAVKIKDSQHYNSL
jgi:cell wall-associated NlpC family hydrolase